MHLAIIFDEVEPIVKTAWGNRFFGNWRHLLNNSPEMSRNLSAVFAGAKEMQELYEDVGSPIGNVLVSHALGLLSWRDSYRLLVEPSGGKISARIARSIYGLTGGHPFLIQYLAHQLWDKSPISEAALVEAVGEFKHTQSHQFENWVEKLDPTDKRVYHFLANHRRPTPKRHLVQLVGDVAANRAVGVLCNTGVAFKRPGEQEHYRTAGGMFRSWFLSEVSQEPELSNMPQTAWVISVHGIRTRGVWQKELTHCLNSEGLKHAPYDYGFFGALALLVPGSRRKQIHQFLQQYSDHVVRDGPRPSVIAHSFGTYIVCKAMEKYPEIEFDQVILCGSIVREDYKWTQRVPSQVNRVLNDMGRSDLWVRLAQWVVEDAGSSGSRGFRDIAGGQVFQRRHATFRHSDFFYLLNFQKNWIPFLKGKQPIVDTLEPNPLRNWRFRITIILILLAFGALVLWGAWLSLQSR